MENKYNFDLVEPAPGPRKPIREGIAVGTIRTRYSKLPPTYKVACEHCGHEDNRTEWQAHHQFHCYECGRDSRGPVERGLELPEPQR